MKINNIYLLTSTNRWSYNGKEKQTIRDLGWLDFSARMLANCEVPVFTTPDPLQVKRFALIFNLIAVFCNLNSDY
ncbi:MAG: hypothetical protein LBJ63_11470 [Prevotellaceae bacterium]|jgi:hypothetical protein|nr:hypothetical protein [Prevotellaceae bacterium]